MTNVQIDSGELQLKIDRYGDMLFKLSLLRLQNLQDAEDVVQEVFYQYLKRQEPFESEEHEKAWLLKVTLNACRKMWGSAWRRHHSGCELEEYFTGTLEADPADLEEDVLDREDRSRVLAAVLALPAKYRDVIHLFYYQELSVQEIAKITGSGVSTVTSQLTRARDLLRRSLKEEYDFG